MEDIYKSLKKKNAEKTRRFYTKSGREISYYGYIPKINNIYSSIETLDDLFEKLLLCYSQETAYPSCQSDYVNDSDPTYGQCAITAMIVNDIFGGTIHRVRVNGGGTHYFNKIDDKYIDLTRDQFELYNIIVNSEPNEEIPREYCGKNEDTKNRYDLLVQRLKRLD